MAEYDLSTLPVLVLEKLFKMLPLTDRGRLASCSGRLAKIMDNPDVWRQVNIDEFDLHTESVNPEISWFHPKFKVVGKLPAMVFSMIEKYGQHFQKVKVVMHSNLIESQSLAVLTELGQRHLIKSVSLRLDMLQSNVVKFKAEDSSLELGESQIWETFSDNRFISFPEPGQEIMHPPASHLIDNLNPDADFAITLPLQSHNIKDIFEQRSDFFTDIKVCTMSLYCGEKSEKCCTLLKKMILSALPVPEDFIARNFRRDAQLSPHPTAQLISSFQNLQELHVNIVNLSDELLLELSRIQGSRKPLHILVIRHIVCECEVEGMSHSHLQLLFSFWNKGTFPQLSSAAWDQLAQSSPSLTVECSVVSTKLPQLLDVIKPQTPLVRLEVLCHTTSSDNQYVPVLQELSENHSRLTIVGMR